MLRIFGHYVPRVLVVLMFVEAVILIAAVYVATMFGLGGGDGPAFGAVSQGAVLFLLCMLAGMMATGLYQRDQRDTPQELILRIAISFLLGLLLMGGIAVVTVGLFDWSLLSWALGGETLVLALFAALILVSSSRLLYLDRTREQLAERVLVLGAGERAMRLAKLRRASDRYGIKILGYLPVGTPEIKVDEAMLVLDDEPLEDMVDRLGVNELVLALDDRRNRVPAHDILACKMKGVTIIEERDFLERQLGKVDIATMQPSDLFYAEGINKAIVRPWGKRTLDIVVSLAMLVLLSPVMLVAALAVKLDSPGTVFYRQVRTGQGSRDFTVFKFRSMCNDAERNGAQWATSNDARVTRVGGFIRKTRIDELPQLFNVLRGDMSFVGPRPERPQFVKELAEAIEYYELRHYVKPGITGWAQIRYPYGASVDDSRQKLMYDLYYIKHYSLFLDLTIILHTVQVVLWRKGAR